MSRAQQLALQESAPAPAHVVAADAGSIMDVISRAAADPATDVDKLERLMGLYERIAATKAEREFNEAMAAAQQEIPQITRNALNDHTRSRYADLETISRALTPIVTKHGFSLSFGTAECPQAGHYRVTCTVAHRGGHSRQEFADLPADTAGSQGKANKTAIQGFGSTVSYGRRYLTCLIFNVAIRGEDNDGQRGRAPAAKITDEQRDRLRVIIEANGLSLPLFCRYFGIAALPDLPAARFAEAERELEREAAQ